MANRKRIKERNKRQLHKRYKQTSVKVLPKEFKAHLLYESKYAVENQTYQLLLNDVYDKNVITPVERYISNQATLIHFCVTCAVKFYAQPRYLLKGTHDCTISGIDSSLNYTKKQNNKVLKKINGEELAKDLDRMILKGVKPNVIQQKTGVSRQIVNWYKNRFHAEVK